MFAIVIVSTTAGVLLTCDNRTSAPPQLVDSVFIQPSHIELHSGDSARFTAWGRSPQGDSVSEPITWLATGGVVFPDGGYIAPTQAGSYTVTATVGFDYSQQATIIVRPPDSLLAGIVSEPRSLELDGGDTARVETFAIYKEPPRLPITPVFASGGGAMRPDGLFTAGTDPGTFPIVVSDSGGRFRDTVWVTVNGPGVATLTLDPATSSVPAGRAIELAATTFDDSGRVLTGRSVAWSTNAPGVATVLSGAGIVTGVAPGTATITATSGHASGTATVQVTGPSATFWPNEPVGFNLISDQSWDALTSLNWSVQFGSATIGLDPTAPFSPPGVLTITYPIGFGGGSAPGTLLHDLPNLHTMYSGLWWKVSNPWEGHPSDVNKIEFAFMSRDNASAILEFYGPPGGPYELHCVTELPGDNRRLPPNVHNVPVTLGVWHRIEWLLVYSTTANPPNGISRWWMDGVLIGDWTNVLFPPDEGISYFKLSPTWGGTGGNKSELDFYWYDHTRISGK